MIDPGLTKTAFLTGAQFAPESEQDAKTPGLGRQSFGGTGVAGAEVDEGDATWWTPGRAR
ncbi:hypothetical protein [Streptomyces neyagawaensis]|uniref:hypothetical protein n=1 Tax=Streptomyces neyagawaensis TaxID=42238 RepID=UPI0006E128EA|nr:hypothetical protein [Streptomyces neyagawaensis]MCL6735077.1 hypothetical protein [Streptomyces neyagawaensis]MDE1687472.1 hypothetical protein [Streptomyces neyagawaensis]